MADHEIFRNVFLALFALHFLIERGLSVLNSRHLRARQEVPAALRDAVTPEDHARSTAYALAHARFGHAGAVLAGALTLGYLLTGYPGYLHSFVSGFTDDVRLRGVAVLGLFAAIHALLTLPLEIYATFGLEARFGFNTTTVRTFVLDKLRSLLVALVLGVPFLYVLVAVLESGAGATPGTAWEWWWLWAALFVIGFQVSMMVVIPAAIAPLFNTFTPLPDGELKTRLEDLARRCDFAARGIFVVDGSRRSTHSNAYFAGLGRARRIVLYDTLLTQLEPAEIGAVLAHEIGHCKKRHVLKMLLLSAALTMAGFFVLDRLIGWAPLYLAFYVTPGQARELGLLIFVLISGSFTFWIGPLFNRLSRKHEYEADAYAAQAGGSEGLASALLKIFKENRLTLSPHPAYSAWNYSHPALVERLAALRQAGHKG